MVMDEKDAARAVSACRYAIRGGDRGCGYRRGIRYGAIDVKAYLDDSARRPYVIIQLEHIEAVRHLDAILSVPGVDGVLIGPYDLSMSMCKPGDWEDPEVAAVFDDCCRRVKASASDADADVNPHDFTVFLPRDASTHYGNSCYSSFTVTDGTGVLWYPDNKRRLYGVRIPGSCAIGLD